MVQQILKKVVRVLLVLTAGNGYFQTSDDDRIAV